MNAKRGRIHFQLSAVAAAAVLWGCGGGGSSNSNSQSTIGGTVATGAAIANAQVTAMDSHGKKTSGTTDFNGAYALTLSNFSGPVLLTAIDPTGQHDPLVSVLSSTPEKGTSTTANITTLTTAIGALLTSTGNALDLLAPTTLAAATSPAAVSKASSTVNAALAEILKVNGLDPGSFNAVTTPFAVNQSGADAVIESVQIIQNGAGKYATSDGSQNALVTTVRQVANPISLPDGNKVSWTIYGNQRKYDASVESRVTRRTFIDHEAGDIGHYDAGVTFNFNLAGPNATNVTSALVTGPGLPSTGIFLLTSTACGEQSLEIPGVAPTPLPSAPGPAGNVTTSSTTPLYRWSWQVFDPAQASAFTPPARYFWSTSQVDLTNVPFYATYTFTLFDAAGNMFDQFQATNPNPAVTANLGTQVEWHTVTSTDLLAPDSPAIGQVTLAWTRNPYAPQLFGVGLYTQSNTAGVIGTASVSNADSSATLIAGNGATTCVNTSPQFLALQPGTYRFTNLQGRNQHGVRFIDNLIFRNGSSAPNAS